MGQAITASAADDGWPATPRTTAVLATAAKAALRRDDIALRSRAQLMLETTVSYIGLPTLDGKPPRTAPDDWSLKIAPISGLSSRLFGTESHIRSKCRRRSDSG